MEILEKMNPNKKHLLVIHPKFCIRAQKQVECLISYSEYQITIITNVKKYGKALTPKIKNNSNIISFSFHKNTLSRFLFRRFIRNLKNNIDIIHCHNEPNYHVVDTYRVFGGVVPIVYDIHDFSSMRSGKPDLFEENAYKNSDAIIHVSDKFIDYGNNKYGVKNCHVIMSLPSKTMKLNPIKKKIEPPFHFVYQGGIIDSEFEKKDLFSYRNYLPIFKEILSENHFVHLYSNSPMERLPNYQLLAKENKKFIIHEKLPYKQLLEEINKYNFGIVGFNFTNNIENEKRLYLNAALGNKLFDYLFAGIPIVTINADTMADFTLNNKCGFVKNKEKSWTETVMENNINVDFNYITNKYCMENQADKIISIYQQLIK